MANSEKQKKAVVTKSPGHDGKNGFPRLPRDVFNFADKFSVALGALAGSWVFILLLVFFITTWIILHQSKIASFDPFPFILLNFIISLITALLTPIILMSQNRTARRDRAQTRYDYLVDRKSLRGIENLHKEIQTLSRQLQKSRHNTPLRLTVPRKRGTTTSNRKRKTTRQSTRAK